MSESISKERSNIMKEQMRIMKAQKEIEKLLTIVGQQINVLKVEELQLRANAVNRNITQTSSTTPTTTVPPQTTPTTPTCKTEIPEEINKQTLDLDILAPNIFKGIDEEDEDEEVDLKCELNV